MVNCVNSSSLRYCLQNNAYTIGTDQRNPPSNAVVKDQKHFVIPSALNGIPIKLIGHDAFHSSLIETITIYAEITKIGSHAFFNCSRLKSIQIPSTVIEIGWRAFMGDNSLTQIFIEGSSQLAIFGSESFFTTAPSPIIFFCNTKIPFIDISNSTYTFSPNTTMYLTKPFQAENVISIQITNNTCQFSYHNYLRTKCFVKMYFRRSLFFVFCITNNS